MQKRQPFTYIEGPDGSADLSLSALTFPLGPTEPYKTPNDVPIPLRHTLRRAVESGLTHEQVAKIFSLPVEWIVLFCDAPKGRG